MRRHRRFDWFGLKTGESVTLCGGVREDLTGLTSKPGEACLTGLVLEIGGGLGAFMVWADGMWCHREACIEAKRSREGGVSVHCSYEKIDKFALGGVYYN